MNPGRLVDRIGKPMALAVIWAAIASLGELIRTIPHLSDTQAFDWTRLALAIVGIAGVAAMVSGHNHGFTGWYILMAWSIGQLPYYADVGDGNYTRQLVDALAGMSTSTTVNGDVTSYSAFGINLVGAALTAIFVTQRKRLENLRQATTV